MALSISNPWNRSSGQDIHKHYVSCCINRLPLWELKASYIDQV